MKIQKIKLDDLAKPKSLTVKMSIKEALFIAKILTTMTPNDHAKVMSDGMQIGHEMSETMTADLFNRFYEDGIDEATHEIG